MFGPIFGITLVKDMQPYVFGDNVEFVIKQKDLLLESMKYLKIQILRTNEKPKIGMVVYSVRKHNVFNMAGMNGSSFYGWIEWSGFSLDFIRFLC